MFVIDDAPMHKIENIQQKIKDCGTKISTIPEGLATTVTMPRRS